MYFINEVLNSGKRFSLFTCLALVISSGYSWAEDPSTSPADLTKDTLIAGTTIVKVTGKLANTDPNLQYTQENYLDQQKRPQTYAFVYKLSSTGILPDSILFHSKTERKTGIELDLTGRVKVLDTPEGTKGHGIKMLFDEEIESKDEL